MYFEKVIFGTFSTVVYLFRSGIIRLLIDGEGKEAVELSRHLESFKDSVCSIHWLYDLCQVLDTF